MHAVVDAYCSFGFGFLHVFSKHQPEAAVAVLPNEVLPFYSERGLTVESLSRTYAWGASVAA
jgi:hypothetical protein